MVAMHVARPGNALQWVNEMDSQRLVQEQHHVSYTTLWIVGPYQGWTQDSNYIGTTLWALLKSMSFGLPEIVTVAHAVLRPPSEAEQAWARRGEDVSSPGNWTELGSGLKLLLMIDILHLYVYIYI